MKSKNGKPWFAFVFWMVIVSACTVLQTPMSPEKASTIAEWTVSPLLPSTTLEATTSATPEATATEIPATAIPLAWKKVSDGQDFQRDTVTAFATDQNNRNLIYAAMGSTGVYRSVDGGLSWQPVINGLASTQVQSLLIDPENSNILLAGTVGGVFKTEDGAENWRRVGDGTFLLMDGQDSKHLYSRDVKGIYETTNQGETWNNVYVLKKGCPDTISAWALHPASGKMLFVTGGEICTGVYQSNDHGRNWNLMGMEGKPGLDGLAIDVDKQGNYSIHVHFPNRYEPEKFSFADFGWYVSDDAGVTWSQINIPCNNIIAHDPADPSRFYCPQKMLYFVKNWKQWNPLPDTNSIIYTAVHIDHPDGMNRILTAGTDVSVTSSPRVDIFISENGGLSWTQQNRGIGYTKTELKIDPADGITVYAASYFAGNNAVNCKLYHSLDGGQVWSLIKWRGGDWCGPTFDVDHILYMIEGGKLQGSWDGGDTWFWDSQESTSYNPKTGVLTDHSLVYALPYSQSVSANPYVKGFIYGVGDTIYYSENSSYIWQPSIGSEGSWDARLFYTDQSRMIYAIGRYHQSSSTDNGRIWQGCGEDITTSRSDSRLALDLQGTRLYLATPGQGVLISTDNCRSWQASNDGLGNLFVNTLAIDPNHSDIVYAGTDGGAFVSYNGGISWGQVNEGLYVPSVVYSIVVDKDGKVYASTPDGIYKLELK